MASETVDPIDWSHPPPTWAVPPERLVHSINRCSSATAGIERATLQPSACEATTLPMRPLRVYRVLPNRSQYILVDGCRSKLVNVVSGMPQGSVLGLLLFLLYTSELFSVMENKLIGYADDSTLISVVLSPGARVTVAESLNRDLVRVNAWCDLWGMKLNASTTKTMIVSRSPTMHPQPPPLTINGTVLKESVDLDIL